MRGAERPHHEVCTGIGTGVTSRGPDAEAETAVVTGLAEDEDGLPTFVSRAVHTVPNESGPYALSLIVGTNPDRRERQGTHRGLKPAEQDMPDDLVFLFRDERDYGIACQPKGIHQAGFVFARECRSVDLANRAVVALGFISDNGHHIRWRG